MRPGITKRTLSPARRQLVELLQRLNFARIEDLAIVQGEPRFEPAPRILREVKFGSENGPRPELVCRDFELKAQLLDLFHLFDQLGTGTLELLEVKHGLPFRVLVVESGLIT